MSTARQGKESCSSGVAQGPIPPWLTGLRFGKRLPQAASVDQAVAHAASEVSRADVMAAHHADRQAVRVQVVARRRGGTPCLRRPPTNPNASGEDLQSPPTAMTDPRLGQNRTALKQAAQCCTCLCKREVELQCEAGGAVTLWVVDAEERRECFIGRQRRHQPSSSPVDITAAAPARAAFVTTTTTTAAPTTAVTISGDSEKRRHSGALTRLDALRYCPHP
jgi:hypothetical protein